MKNESDDKSRHGNNLSQLFGGTFKECLNFISSKLNKVLRWILVPFSKACLSITWPIKLTDRKIDKYVKTSVIADTFKLLSTAPLFSVKTEDS